MKKAVLFLLIAGSTATFSASADQNYVGCIGGVRFDRSDDLKGGSLSQELTKIPSVTDEVRQQDGLVVQKNYRIVATITNSMITMTVLKNGATTPLAATQTEFGSEKQKLWLNFAVPGTKIVMHAMCMTRINDLREMPNYWDLL